MTQKEHLKKRMETYKTRPGAPRKRGKYGFGWEKKWPKFRLGVWANAHSSYTRNGNICYRYTI
jgi:hypothetical protein